jgi:hypothetical protein
MRAFPLALVLLSGCAPSRAITNAGTNVSVAAQHLTSTVDAVKSIANVIESHVEYSPEVGPPTSPLDAILQAAITTTPDLLALYRAAKQAYEQIRAMKQKAEVAP